MSLINDALKRAKQKHDQQAPPPFRGAPLHATPPPRPSRLWPVAIISLSLAIIVSGVGVWLALRNQPATPTPRVETVTPPSVPAAQPVAATKPAEPAPTPAPATVEAAPAPATSPAPVPVPEATPAVTPAPIQPVVPVVRLQGILWNPARPAAILNGRTMFVGETVSDITVIAISQKTTTVVWGGKTNVLALP